MHNTFEKKGPSNLKSVLWDNKFDSMGFFVSYYCHFNYPSVINDYNLRFRNKK